MRRAPRHHQTCRALRRARVRRAQRDTDISLHVAQPVDIAISVTATPGYWVSEAGSWTKGTLGFVGFGAIVTAARWLWRRSRKRKKATPADLKEPAEPAKSP
jgi:hypothetical protein